MKIQTRLLWNSTKSRNFEVIFFNTDPKNDLKPSKDDLDDCQFIKIHQSSLLTADGRTGEVSGFYSENVRTDESTSVTSSLLLSETSDFSALYFI